MVNIFFDLFRRVDKNNYGVDDMPEFPFQVLYGHIIRKNAQVASVLCFGGSIISAFWNRTSLLKAILYDCGGSAFLGIFGLTTLPTTFRCMQLDADGVDDRGYRLFHHYSQSTVDWCAVPFGVTGALLNVYFGPMVYK
eukprot:Platyproteum_vivax@DN2413_c0_g1_i1.p1